MTYRVLLCDDDPMVCAEWFETVSGVAPAEHYEVLKPHDNGEVRQACKEIFARQSAQLGGQEHERGPCLFDDADILVLDYDLLYIDESNARHTGESLAWLLRTFSTVDVIVVVNQFQEAQFDLSVRGHIASHADLNLDARLLGTEGLWTDPPWDGFRPWHWQTLSRAVDTQRARRWLVEKHFDDPIVDVLDMREEDVLRLSDTAIGFIAPEAGDWQGIREQTFKSFARSHVNGRYASDLFKDKGAACRFAAARIGKWLERQVLGPQDALMDLPHLVQYLPFFLGNNLCDLEAWNEMVCGSVDALEGVPEECWFGQQGQSSRSEGLREFLSRPAVWGQRLENDAGVRKRRGAFDYSNIPPFVFLEDASTFVPMDHAKQFRAGHHNAHDWRFAKCFDQITYAPQRRLAYAE